MRLSQHFRLDEFTRSQTAERHDIDMTVPDFVIANLTRLCAYFLEPLREELDAPINISSGFRPVELNIKIGGSKTSAHMFGRAADFTVAGIKPRKVCLVIRDMDLIYDQNIHEFGKWTHWGIADGTGRVKDLTAYRAKGKTIYVPGIHKIKDLV